LDKEEAQAPVSPVTEDLPAWLRDETGETVAEPPKIEPTHSTDWQPIEVKEVEEPAPPQPESYTPSQEQPIPVAPPKKKAPARSEPKPKPDSYREPVTRKGIGMLTMTVDMMLGQARNELSRSNIPGALEVYARLIKKGRFLDEVIFDLRDALYRYPVEVSIWQSLGDAYMRANRLQDALDAYTKAEELLR
jgi:tetratricopeptide (TPR) repeat protein